MTRGVPSEGVFLASPAFCLGAREELARSWLRGGASVGKSDSAPTLPKGDKAQMTRLSWLRAQCFKEWVGNGSFMFSAGTLEQLRKVFVPRPIGDCSPPSEDGKSSCP